MALLVRVGATGRARRRGSTLRPVPPFLRECRDGVFFLCRSIGGEGRRVRVRLRVLGLGLGLGWERRVCVGWFRPPLPRFFLFLFLFLFLFSPSNPQNHHPPPLGAVKPLRPPSYRGPNPLPIVYCEQIRVFKAGVPAVNTLAWNNKIGLGFYFVGF